MMTGVMKRRYLMWTLSVEREQGRHNYENSVDWISAKQKLLNSLSTANQILYPQFMSIDFRFIQMPQRHDF